MKLKKLLLAIILATLLLTVFAVSGGFKRQEKTSVSLEVPAFSSGMNNFRTPHPLVGDNIFPGSGMPVTTVTITGVNGKATAETSDIWKDYVHVEKVTGEPPDMAVTVTYSNPDDSVKDPVTLECRVDPKVTDEERQVFICRMPAYLPTDDLNKVFGK